MLESTKYLFTRITKHRIVIVFAVSLILILTLTYKIVADGPASNLTLSDSNSPLLSSSVDLIPTYCQVTHRIQTICQEQNPSYINPARHVVEQLLKIIKYNRTACRSENTEEHLVVIIVDTARDHFIERQLIRQTWGSMNKYKDWHIRTFFLVGQSAYCSNLEEAENEKENSVSIEEKTLMEEYQKYGDIVIGAFADTYRNLTYKHLMGLKFVQEKCPDADFVIKTDDDMFVDIPSILNMRTMELPAIQSEKGSSSEKLFDIYCHHFRDFPIRDPNEKWFSTREEWPEDTYPAYCLGNDYAISMDWLTKIYSVRSLGGFFWVDDVFILGKLREIAEKMYNETTNRLNIWAAGKVTDRRSQPMYVRRKCEKKTDFDFGWFVFLDRSDPYFVKTMECLWRRVLQSENITAILFSKYAKRY